MSPSLEDPGRLRALERTGLMDAGPQESLDRLTRLASRLLEAPVALVSLVDGERQYFASEVGLGLRETPLSHSFCQHVVVSEAALVVPDARVDPRFRENLAVPDLGVIAYAGVPLNTSAGDTLGSLCVIESSPRNWSEDDLELLRELARSVISEIELRMVNNDLRDREHQLGEAQALARFGSFELEVHGRFRWSDELCRIFGRPIGFSPTVNEFLECVHLEERETLRTDLEQARHGDFGETEYRITRPDGEIRHVHTRWFGSVDTRGKFARMWGTIQDVTEQTMADAEIRHAREYAEAIITAMGEGYALTLDGVIVAVNEKMCTLTGFSQEELIGAGIPFPFWPSDRLNESRQIRDRIVSDGGGTFEIELQRADGSRFEAEITAHQATTSDGSHLGFVNTVRDVSERRRHESELERERRDLNEAQAVAEVGSWEYDLEFEGAGRWSAQLRRMLGIDLSGPAPTRAGLLALVAAADRSRVRDELVRRRNSNEPWAAELGMLAIDGRELIVAFRLQPSIDRDGHQTGVYGTIQDITERARREAEERGLRRIAEQVAGNAGASAVFTAVASEVQRLFNAHSGFVTRFDPAASFGSVVSGHRADGRPMDEITFRRDSDTASAAVLRTGLPARVDTHVSPHSDPTHDWLERNEISSGVAAPVTVGGELWGTLSMGFTGAIPPQAEQRLARFARLVSMAIANADAWDLLSHQAATDSVTSLPNRHTFQERLHSEIARAHRYDRSLSLALLDLDHFKAVNDTYGHQAGDSVLAEIGRRLAQQAREGELIARIGGEEFGWLMPETDNNGAYLAAERLRRVIESEPFATVGTITVSVGVCTSALGCDADDLVRFADNALYRAKHNGRNTTFVYSAETAIPVSAER